MVALVLGLLTVAALGFTIWLMEARDSEGPTYEVQFREAVHGLTNGSLVELQGVPIGRVTDVRLEPEEPSLATVRFVLIRDFRLHQGVSASISRSLINGSALINLEGNDRRAPALVQLPGRRFPLIAPKNIGNSSDAREPTAVIQSTALGVERISKKLDHSGQKKFAQGLAELAERSQEWAGSAENMAGQISGSSKIDDVGTSLITVGESAEKLRLRLERSRAGIRRSLTEPSKNAQKRANRIAYSLSSAQPKVRQFEEDVRHATRTLRSIRSPVGQVSDVVQTVESSGPRPSAMPEYRPQE